MSVSNLLQPNNYNLFCNSLAIGNTGPVGPSYLEITTANYSGFINQSGVPCILAILSFGSFVQLSFNGLAFKASSGYTASQPLQLINIIPPGYAPIEVINAPVTVINNNTAYAGVCNITPNGTITIGLVGNNPISFVGCTGTCGVQSVIASYTTQ